MPFQSYKRGYTLSIRLGQTCDIPMTPDEGITTNTPTAEFIEQVHGALERLHDFPFLQNHPLAQARQQGAPRPDELAGQRLRRELIDAVETLNPGREYAFLSPQARLYNLLHMHYVDGMTVQAVANELGISMRQAHRDLRRGEESVAMVLWARQPHQPPATTETTVGEAPAEFFETHPRATDLRALTQRARKAVEKLAEGRMVSFDFDLPDQPVIVWTDPAAAQQVWISLVSSAIANARPGNLGIQLTLTSEQAQLVLTYMPAHPAASTWVVDPVVAELAQRLGWTLHSIQIQPGGQHTICVQMSPHQPTVLVIDDNKGLVELIERYLTGQPCRVVAAQSGLDGLRIAQDLLPNAIILDVMMPGMDGWEVLQLLRNNLQTAKTPVIICTVFNNPELALSLGATLYLLKPIRPGDILDALRRLGLV
ncbi:MAG: response regulator [Chloroflexi bacterium]|nr:response regulator [Chloroflexota bacterium]